MAEQDQRLPFDSLDDPHLIEFPTYTIEANNDNFWAEAQAFTDRFPHRLSIHSFLPDC